MAIDVLIPSKVNGDADGTDELDMDERDESEDRDADDGCGMLSDKPLVDIIPADDRGV